MAAHLGAVRTASFQVGALGIGSRSARLLMQRDVLQPGPQLESRVAGGDERRWGPLDSYQNHAVSCHWICVWGGQQRMGRLREAARFEGLVLEVGKRQPMKEQREDCLIIRT